MDNFTPLIIIPVVLAILFLFRRRRAAYADDGKPANKQTKESAVAIAEKLEALGYFKYADPKDIPALKRLLAGGFVGNSVLLTLDDDKTLMPLDYRLYRFDGEDLFELGGFANMLKDMQPLFDKMNFTLACNSDIEEDAEPGIDHFISLNDREYIVFKNFDDYGWCEAAQRFAEIINDQLALQNKDERLYLINGGNDGQAVFLTDAQFAVIDPLITDTGSKPLKVEDWCKALQIDPTAYLGTNK